MIWEISCEGFPCNLLFLVIYISKYIQLIKVKKVGKKAHRCNFFFFLCDKQLIKS